MKRCETRTRYARKVATFCRWSITMIVPSASPKMSFPRPQVLGHILYDWKKDHHNSGSAFHSHDLPSKHPAALRFPFSSNVCRKKRISSTEKDIVHRRGKSGRIKKNGQKYIVEAIPDSRPFVVKRNFFQTKWKNANDTAAVPFRKEISENIKTRTVYNG